MCPCGGWWGWGPVGGWGSALVVGLDLRAVDWLGPEQSAMECIGSGCGNHVRWGACFVWVGKPHAMGCRVFGCTLTRVGHERSLWSLMRVFFRSFCNDGL